MIYLNRIDKIQQGVVKLLSKESSNVEDTGRLKKHMQKLNTHSVSKQKLRKYGGSKNIRNFHSVRSKKRRVYKREEKEKTKIKEEQGKKEVQEEMRKEEQKHEQEQGQQEEKVQKVEQERLETIEQEKEQKEVQKVEQERLETMEQEKEQKEVQKVEQERLETMEQEKEQKGEQTEEEEEQKQGRQQQHDESENKIQIIMTKTHKKGVNAINNHDENEQEMRHEEIDKRNIFRFATINLDADEPEATNQEVCINEEMQKDITEIKNREDHICEKEKNTQETNNKEKSEQETSEQKIKRHKKSEQEKHREKVKQQELSKEVQTEKNQGECKQRLENYEMSKQKTENHEMSEQEIGNHVMSKHKLENLEMGKSKLENHEISKPKIGKYGISTYKVEKHETSTHKIVEHSKSEQEQIYRAMDIQGRMELLKREHKKNEQEISTIEKEDPKKREQTKNVLQKSKHEKKEKEICRPEKAEQNIRETHKMYQNKSKQELNRQKSSDKETIHQKHNKQYLNATDISDEGTFEHGKRKNDIKIVDAIGEKTVEQDKHKQVKNTIEMSDQQTMKQDQMEQNISVPKEVSFYNEKEKSFGNSKTCRRTRNDVDIERYLHLYPALQKFTNKYRNIMEETRKRMVLRDVTDIFKKTDGVDIGHHNHYFLRIILKVIRKWLVANSTPEEIAILERLRNEILEKLVTSKQEYSQIIKSREMMKANLITLLLIDLDSERTNEDDVKKYIKTEKMEGMQNMTAENCDTDTLETEEENDISQAEEECDGVTEKEMNIEEKWKLICNTNGSKSVKYQDPYEREVYKGRFYAIMYGNIMLPYDKPDSYWNIVYRGRTANAVMNYLRLCDKYHKKREKKLRQFVKKLSPDYDHTDTAMYFNNEQELCYIYYLQKLKENEKLYMSYVDRMKEKSKENAEPARSRYGTRIATGTNKGKPQSDMYVYTENRKRNTSSHLDSQTNRKRKRTKYIIPLGEDEGSEMHLIEKEIAKYRFLPTGVFYSRVCKSFIANWICESNKKQVKVPFKLFEYGIEGGILLSIIARFLRLNNQLVVLRIYNEIPFEKKKEMLEMMKVQEDNDEFFATVIATCKGAEAYLDVMNYYVDVKKNKVQGGQLKNGRLAGWKRRKLKYASCANVDYGSAESEYMRDTSFPLDYDAIREEVRDELELEDEEVAAVEQEEERAKEREEMRLESLTISSLMSTSERFTSMQSENIAVHRGCVNNRMLQFKSNFKGMDTLIKKAGREAQLPEPSSLTEVKPVPSAMNPVASIRPFTPLRKYNLERKKIKYENGVEKLPIGVYYYQGAYVANWWDTNLKKQYKVPFKAADYGLHKAKLLAIVSRNMRSPNLADIKATLKEVLENEKVDSMDLLDFSVVVMNYLSKKNSGSLLRTPGVANLNSGIPSIPPVMSSTPSEVSSTPLPMIPKVSSKISVSAKCTTTPSVPTPHSVTTSISSNMPTVPTVESSTPTLATSPLSVVSDNSASISTASHAVSTISVVTSAIPSTLQNTQFIRFNNPSVASDDSTVVSDSPATISAHEMVPAVSSIATIPSISSVSVVPDTLKLTQALTVEKIVK